MNSYQNPTGPLSQNYTGMAKSYKASGAFSEPVSAYKRHKALEYHMFAIYRDGVISDTLFR
jgi:hypothetical protein